MTKRKSNNKRNAKTSGGKPSWLRTPRGFKEWATAIAAALCIILSVATMLAGRAGGFDPRHHPTLAVYAMAFPIMAAAQAIVVVLWLLCRKWWWALLFATPLIFNYGNVWTHCPLNIVSGSTTAAEDSTRFTFMTWNTRNMTDMDKSLQSPNRVVTEILRLDPDMVCLQECWTVSNERWSGITKEQADSIKARYPYRATSYDDMQFLSKFPIIHADDFSSDRSTYEAKSYFVNVNGMRLNVVSIHLQSYHLDEDDKAMYRTMVSRNAAGQIEDHPRSTWRYLRRVLYPRLAKAMRIRARQAEEVAAVVTRANGNVIVCGDFNDVPYSYAYRTIKGSMTDAFAHAGLGYGHTYHDNRLLFRIDHVLYKGTIEAVDARRPNPTCSDHYPVVVEFVNRKTKQ